MVTRNKSEFGTSLLELLFVLPFLFLFFYAALEITRYITAAKIVNVISQEAAFRAYRGCADFAIYKKDANGELILDGDDTPELQYTGTNGVNQLTTNCVNKIVNDLRTNANSFLGFNAIQRLVISIYRFIPKEKSSSCNDADIVRIYPPSGVASPSMYSLSGNNLINNTTGAKIVTAGYIRTGGSSSKVVVGGVTSPNGQCLGRQRVVISEIRYQFDKIGPFEGPRVDGGYGSVIDLFGLGNQAIIDETTIL